MIRPFLSLSVPIVAATALAVSPVSAVSQVGEPSCDFVRAGTAWRVVETDGAVFCAPETWELRGPVGMRGDSGAIRWFWAGEGRSVRQSLVRVRRSPDRTLEEQVDSVIGVPELVFQQTEPVNGRSVELRIHELRDTYSTSAIWRAESFTMAGTASTLPAARRQLEVYRTVMLSPDDAPAVARSPAAQEVVPREFFDALASPFPYGPDTPPAVLIGEMPPGGAMPVPADGRIIGTVLRRGQSATAIAVPGEPAEVLADYVDRLAEAGWERYQPPTRGGFASGIPGPVSTFCLNDGVSLSISVHERPEGGSLLRLNRSSARRMSICAADAERSTAAMRHESPIPPLAPPELAVPRGAGSGGGSDGWDAHTTLRTPLSAEEVFDHYDAQLTEAGWTRRDRQVVGTSALASYSFTDEDGVSWVGLFTVVRFDEDDRVYPHVRVVNPEGRR